MDAETSPPPPPPLDPAAEAARIRGEFEAFKAEAATNYKRLQDTHLETVKDGAIAESLVGLPLRSGPATIQVRKLLGAEFEAVPTADGRAEIRHKSTGETPAVAIPKLIGSPDYAHFLQPRTQGGTARPGGNPSPAPSWHEAPPAPANLGEAVLQQWTEGQKSRGASIGLVPRRPTSGR